MPRRVFLLVLLGQWFSTCAALLLPRDGLSPAVSQRWRPILRFEEEPQISGSPGRCPVMWALTSQVRGYVRFYIKITVTPAHMLKG